MSLDVCYIACCPDAGPCTAASIEIILALKLLKFIDASSYGVLIEYHTLQKVSGFPFKVFLFTGRLSLTQHL